MTHRLARNVVAAGLGLAASAALSLGLAGCGGQGTTSDDAVVVTAPGEAVPVASTAPSNTPATTPAGGDTATATKSATKEGSTPAASSETAKAGGWGTLKGQVVFGGSPPAAPVLEEKGKAEKDPQYCAKDAPIKSERLVVDGGTKGVKNVLVYIPKPTAVNDEAKASKSSTDIVFDQEKCIFKPHVLGMMAGSTIKLKSSDEVNHNVNAKLQKNSPFNSILAAGQEAPFAPTDAERAPVPVTCDIHPWMQAWWMVLDNPYFAVTDEKGNFEMKNVPTGNQKVDVWQEATGFVTPASGESLAINGGSEPTTKTWTIDPSKVKPAR